jgi:hypothetical protein
MKKLRPSTPLDALPLSTRSYNVMKNEGVTTLQEMADKLADPATRRWPNFGKRSFQECSDIVATMSKSREPLHPLEAALHASLAEHRTQWGRLIQIHSDINKVLSKVTALTTALENALGRSGPQPSIRSLEGKIDRLSTNVIMLANRVRGSGITGETFEDSKP